MTPETITISVSEYQRLHDRDDRLSRLEVYGVDNWVAYSDAINDTEGYFEEASK